MKIILVLVLSIVIAGLYIKPDSLIEGRYNIYEGGKRKGFIIKDPMCPDRFKLYDKNWNREGYLEKDDFDRWEIKEVD